MRLPFIDSDLLYRGCFKAGLTVYIYRQLQIIHVHVYMLLCQGRILKVHLKIIHAVSFWIDAWMGTVAASCNNQLSCPLYRVCLSDTFCVSYVRPK